MVIINKSIQIITCKITLRGVVKYNWNKVRGRTKYILGVITTLSQEEQVRGWGRGVFKEVLEKTLYGIGGFLTVIEGILAFIRGVNGNTQGILFLQPLVFLCLL